MTDEELDDYFADVSVALDFIEEDSKAQMNVSGSIRCPRCGGRLTYSIADNGHITGSCENVDCLRWTE
jgi:hypothetical protein